MWSRLCRFNINADRGYDGDKNFQSVFGMEMLPNIKQRINAKNKGKNRE
jgi:hypothetical protein